jgi:hypothetical protein
MTCPVGQIAQHSYRHISAAREIGLHLRKFRGDGGPSHVEYVGRLADAFPAQQPADHVAEPLDLRPSTLALEGIGPGALNMG